MMEAPPQHKAEQSLIDRNENITFDIAANAMLMGLSRDLACGKSSMNTLSMA
jgi:hypothetical protein